MPRVAKKKTVVVKSKKEEVKLKTPTKKVIEPVDEKKISPISISIKGLRGSGKSTIAALIKSNLKKTGFKNIELIDGITKNPIRTDRFKPWEEKLITITTECSELLVKKPVVIESKIEVKKPVVVESKSTIKRLFSQFGKKK